MTIGGRLDQAMRDAGYKSQSALARASGVPQATISRILKSGDGAHGPAPDTLKRLAAACTVSFEWLNEGRSATAPLNFVPAPENLELTIYDEIIGVLTLYRQSTPEARKRITEYARDEDKLPLILRRLPARNDS
jgi:transcriptional regulator with XRE-family HTH domain